LLPVTVVHSVIDLETLSNSKVGDICPGEWRKCVAQLK